MLEIYTKEFVAHSRQYYDEAIKDGRISVNSKKVSCDYKLQDNDKIVHAIVRKETPVLDLQIKILYEDSTMIAVDKPSSMPVHEGGNYKYNTLMGILENEHGYKGLKCVHRLDKQTSGIVFFAKNENTANEFREAMTSDTVHKEYIARVKGDFRIAAKGDEITVKKWVFVEDYKKMLHGCEEESKLTIEQMKTAKEAETLFKFESYDEESDTSIVRCFPRTGRTHQIRVHLKSLGAPIANDLVYGGEIINDGMGKED